MVPQDLTQQDRIASVLIPERRGYISREGGEKEREDGEIVGCGYEKIERGRERERDGERERKKDRMGERELPRYFLGFLRLFLVFPLAPLSIPLVSLGSPLYSLALPWYSLGSRACPREVKMREVKMREVKIWKVKIWESNIWEVRH